MKCEKIKLLQKIKNKLLKSSFARRSSILLSGGLLSQLIAFSFLPFITERYSPELIGIGASFISISSIISVFFTLQFHSAIFLPNEKKYYDGLAILSFSISILVSLLCFTILILFGENLLNLMGLNELKDWLFFIPLFAFFLSVTQILNNWLAKEQRFSAISINVVLQSLIYNILAVILSGLLVGSAGLIVSKLTSAIFVGVIFIVLFLLNITKSVNTSDLLRLARKYKKFPKISFPHAIFSTAVRDLPVLIIAGYFDARLAGLYFIGLKFSQLPMQILSKALYSVVIIELADALDKKRHYVERLKWFLLISIPITIIVIIITPLVLEFILDESFKEASGFLYLLIPLYYFKLLGSTFAQTSLTIHQELGFNFLIGLLIFISTIIAFYIGYLYQDLMLAITVQVISNIILIIFKLVKAYRIIQ